MRLIIRLAGTGICFLLAAGGLRGVATNRYVATNGTSVYPYTNWADAGTNIIEVVAVANGYNAGDIIFVSNGTYYLTNQISITANVIVTNFSGDRTNIVINGNYPNTRNRCFFINHANAIIDGFTITNGCIDSAWGTGGGVQLGSGAVRNSIITGNNVTNTGGTGGGVDLYGSGIISNCIINGNSSKGEGGGIYLRGNGALIIDCTISDNQTSGDKGGGGIYFTSGAVTCAVEGCTISGNAATAGWAGGIHMGGNSVNVVKGCSIISNRNVASSGNQRCGGVSFYKANGGLVSNCVISGNTATNAGAAGGVYFYQGGEVVDSQITSNTAGACGGARCDMGGILRNCVVIGNEAVSNDSGGVGAYAGGRIYNCLIARNIATNTDARGGGIYAWNVGNSNGFISSCTLVDNQGYLGGGLALNISNNFVTNCIIFSNTASFSADIYTAFAANTSAFYYCCSTFSLPLPNVGNITNYPGFISISGGDYRLSFSSPCINVGTNESWMLNARDLDGHMRLDHFSRQVDIGAYEFIPSGTMFTIP